MIAFVALVLVVKAFELLAYFLGFYVVIKIILEFMR
jgi:hypothetical protein